VVSLQSVTEEWLNLVPETFECAGLEMAEGMQEECAFIRLPQIFPVVQRTAQAVLSDRVASNWWLMLARIMHVQL
jgi:hypothetical protein